MHFTSLLLSSSLALMASAVPHNSHRRSHIEARDDDKFKIHVTNNCGSTKTFGLFQISPDFQMIQKSQPHAIPNGESHTIHAPFKQLGMRLSATADQGPDAQWDAQALFEFGYSSYLGQDGTAYDLSFMEGSDPGVGISANPTNPECPKKSCYPGNCSLADAWTDAAQIANGSPADTVCYHGKTEFDVVFCPSD